MSFGDYYPWAKPWTTKSLRNQLSNPAVPVNCVNSAGPGMGLVFNIAIGVNWTSFNVRAWLVAYTNWNGSTPLAAVILIGKGVVISGANPSSPAMDCRGLPSGSIVTLQGTSTGRATIVGCGGLGGIGGGDSIGATAATAGGDAISSDGAVVVIDDTYIDIYGGGGGGGGGGGDGVLPPTPAPPVGAPPTGAPPPSPVGSPPPPTIGDPPPFTPPPTQVFNPGDGLGGTGIGDTGVGDDGADGDGADGDGGDGGGGDGGGGGGGK